MSSPEFSVGIWTGNPGLGQLAYKQYLQPWVNKKKKMLVQDRTLKNRKYL